MKKLVLPICILLASSAFAQDLKASKIIGVNLGGGYGNFVNFQSNQELTLGTFLSNNWYIGIYGNRGMNKQAIAEGANQFGTPLKIINTIMKY